MVGASGFEPPASCSRSRRASQAALRPDNQHGKPNQTLAHRGNLQSSTRRGNGQQRGFPAVSASSCFEIRQNAGIGRSSALQKPTCRRLQASGKLIESRQNSEHEFQGPLHLPRTSQHLRVVAERAVSRWTQADSRGVEVCRVREVENIPMKHQTGTFSELDVLCQTDIGAEVFVRAQYVALPAVACCREPEELDRQIRIRKDIRYRLSTSVRCCFHVLRTRARANVHSNDIRPLRSARGVTLQVPARGPRPSVDYVCRRSAIQVRDSR